MAAQPSTGNLSEDDAVTAAKAEPGREFGFLGVPSRIFWMAVIAFGVADLTWCAVVLANFWPFEAAWNPIAKAGQAFNTAAASLGPEDGWAFLGVLATLVVAVQVAAFANQQARDGIAYERAYRFTGAAMLTGAAALLAIPAFGIAFAGTKPGIYVAMLGAIAGITFFAADGASVVVQRDRRSEIMADLRQRLRRHSGPVHVGEAARERPVRTALTGLAVAAVWGVGSAWACLILTAAVGVALGYHVGFGSWWPAFQSIGSLALVLTVIGATASITLLAMKSRAGWASRSSSYTLAGVTLALGLWAVGFIAVGGVASRQPWWAVVLAALAVALPFGLPFAALGSPSKNRWTVAGGVQSATESLRRMSLGRLLRRHRYLTELFDRA